LSGIFDEEKWLKIFLQILKDFFYAVIVNREGALRSYLDGRKSYARFGLRRSSRF
jgi:hypothetical protein